MMNSAKHLSVPVFWSWMPFLVCQFFFDFGEGAGSFFGRKVFAAAERPDEFGVFGQGHGERDKRSGDGRFLSGSRVDFDAGIHHTVGKFDRDFDAFAVFVLSDFDVFSA